MNSDVRKHLESLSEKELASFTEKLTPSAENVLGIRIPVLHEYAKKLAREQGTDVIQGEDFYHEEKMLHGMVIGYLKTDTESRLVLIRDFVPLIDSWGVCDSFCSTLKFTNQNRERVWDFLQTYIRSDQEFEKRFGAVMLLCYYVNDAYIDKTVKALRTINTEEYYSSMAVAWAAAECFIKFPEKTLPYIENKVFDKDTHNRTIRKICDSYRVDQSKKEELKKLTIK